MKKIKCPSCNKEILDNVRACPQCGYDDITSYILNIERKKDIARRQKELKEREIRDFKINHPVEYIQPQTQPQKDIIHCPKCNSTAITTGARGVNNFWGFIGASKTVNRCGNCGYTWKPNGR